MYYKDLITKNLYLFISNFIYLGYFNLISIIFFYYVIYYSTIKTNVELVYPFFISFYIRFKNIIVLFIYAIIDDLSI